jgi:hypothetical protein
MSPASTGQSVLAVTLCMVLTSTPDSSSTWVDSTASLPDARISSAMSSQSCRRSSLRREQTVSPR